MSDLASAVSERHEAMRNAPVRQDTQAFGAVDQERILQLIGLNPRDPRAHAVIAVARRYGLDPVLGHISIIPRSQMPYITRDGYLHIAHRSGQLDGIEVLEGPERRGNEWHARVAIFRKDMAHAFVYPGRAELARENGPEMAITRAERRALKRAFAVTLPREFGDEDEGQPFPPAPILPRPEATQAPERPDPAPSPGPERQAPTQGDETADESGPEMMRPVQRRAMFVLFSQLGIGDDERVQRLGLTSEIVGRDITSSSQLTKSEAELLLSELNRKLDERK
jgi:hypothetical protein